MRAFAVVFLVAAFGSGPGFTLAAPTQDDGMTFSLSSSAAGVFNVPAYGVDGLGKSLSLEFGRGNSPVQFRHVEVIEATAGNPIIACSNVPYVPCRNTYYREYAALVGWAAGTTKNRIQLFGGLGYLEFDPGNVARQDQKEARLDQRHEFQTVGLALSVGYVWAPSRFFAVGPRLIANLNNQSSFAGALVELKLGRIR